MTTLASIIGALVAALGVAIMAFSRERGMRVKAEDTAKSLEGHFNAARETADHMSKVARARDQRLAEVMISHTEALGKLEKAGLDVEDAEGDAEKIAGLFNHAFVREEDPDAN